MNGKGVVKVFEKGVDPTEYSVDRFVPAPVVPPSFNDSFVVPIYLNVSASTNKPCDGSDEKLEANCFGPSNVTSTIECLPARDKTPRSPFVIDDDGNADA